MFLPGVRSRRAGSRGKQRPHATRLDSTPGSGAGSPLRWNTCPRMCRQSLRVGTGVELGGRRDGRAQVTARRLLVSPTGRGRHARVWTAAALHTDVSRRHCCALSRPGRWNAPLHDFLRVGFINGLSQCHPSHLPLYRTGRRPFGGLGHPRDRQGLRHVSSAETL